MLSQHYADRAAELVRLLDGAVRNDRLCTAILFTIAAIGVVFIYFAVHSELLPKLPVLLVPTAGIYVSQCSRRSKRNIRNLSRIHAYYQRGIARLTHSWDELETGDEYHDYTHPYASDLDLFGRGSLYQLLCSARTTAGQDTLASWMKTTASTEEAASRRTAIEELRGNIALRESLAAASGITNFKLGTFEEWVTSAPVQFPAWSHPTALLLSLAVVTSPVLYWLGILSPAGFVLSCAIEAASVATFAAIFSRRVHLALEWLQLPSAELPLLVELLKVLANQSFTAPALAALSQRLKHAPRDMFRLNLFVKLLNFRHRQEFTLVSYCLLWGTQLTMTIDRWRRRNGSQLVDSLVAAGEFEALVSIATYADEHPGCTFPEFSTEGACFEAEAMRHPLLPEATSVPNSVSLHGLLILTGGNMSGKSTFLRAIGLNAVLAGMGAPVYCARLRISPLRIFAVIRIHDSLADGRSKFLAEIEKLRDIIQAAATTPVIFLVDEIMSGTNSHDRRVAAECIARVLQERGAIGLFSTHDLALANLPGTNCHFSDDGDLNFNYKLLPGIAATTNGLNIVRRLGIHF